MLKIKLLPKVSCCGISYNQTLPAFLQNQKDFTYYGVDWDGPVGITEGNGQVEVPITTCPLNSAELQQLREQIDPFVDDDNQGIDTFNETVNAVHRILQSRAHTVTL